MTSTENLLLGKGASRGTRSFANACSRSWDHGQYSRGGADVATEAPIATSHTRPTMIRWAVRLGRKALSFTTGLHGLQCKGRTARSGSPWAANRGALVGRTRTFLSCFAR